MKFAYLSFVSLFAILFSACNVYQLNTVTSANPDWKLENDSSFYYHDSLFDIGFAFNSNSLNNLESAIKIKNNTDNGLVFDWKRSAIILNGQSFSLGSTVMKTVGNYGSENSTYKWNKWLSTGSTSGAMSSVSTISDNSTFIPPSSYIESEKQSFGVAYLNNLQLNNLPEIITLRADTLIDRTVNVVYGDLYSFGKDNSPYNLKLYLTYKVVTKEDNSGVDKTLSNDFYVDKILQLKKSPYDLSSKGKLINNKFITSKSN